MSDKKPVPKTDETTPVADPTPKAKQKHNMLSVNIRNDRMPIYEGLLKLGERLHARTTDLVWDALGKYVENPPKVAPQGSSPNTGSAVGFWVCHDLDAGNHVKAIRIVEGVRSMTSGRTFFRYSKDDPKGRERSLRKAQRTAGYDAQITGVILSDKGAVVEQAK